MISEQYRCVFVHIPKTAGQSIEQVFLNLHGLDWQSRSELLLRANNDPELGPPRLAHLHASEYVRYGYLSEDQFRDWFSFAVVRNPWDRLVSLYHYLGFNDRCTFNYFVQNVFLQYLVGPLRWFVGPQYEFVCDENKQLLVDQVIYFEQLEQGFSLVAEAVNIGVPALPHVNAKDSARGRTMAPELASYVGGIPVNQAENREQNMACYQDYFNSVSRSIVSEYYATDIAMFDYKFTAND